jgi:hypothetical protein
MSYLKAKSIQSEVVRQRRESRCLPTLLDELQGRRWPERWFIGLERWRWQRFVWIARDLGRAIR